MYVVKGKKWDEYMMRKKSELFEKLVAIEYERLNRRVSIDSLEWVRNGERCLRVEITAPAYGTLCRRTKGGKYCFDIPSQLKNEEGKFYLYVIPIRYNTSVVYCKTIDYEREGNK